MEKNNSNSRQQQQQTQPKTVKVEKKFMELEAGDVVTHPDGREFELAPGFKADGEWVMVYPLNGAPRARFQRAVIEGCKFPTYEVMIKEKADEIQPQT
jgi:hypothetical protein